MELQYLGENCIRITTKKANIIVDGMIQGGNKSLIKDGDTLLFTEYVERKVDAKTNLLIDIPGEYEIGDTEIVGIPAKNYKADDKKFNNTIFTIENEEVKLAIIGNISKDLSDSQLESLGEVDVIVIPVGGNDTCLSGTDALSIIKKIEPYIVIPTHYVSSKTKYESAQADLKEALKELAMEPSETVSKIKLKSSMFNEGDSTKLVVLED